MCNAWNHSPDCRCGWGGIGHLGRRANLADDRWANVRFKTYRELVLGATYPNAHCPICGERVFFYESPYGGRVFFDELGPPWPKHPCTSKSQVFNFVKRITIDFSAISELPSSPRKDGWQPFLCEVVERLSGDQGIQKLVGFLGSERKTFFVRDGGLCEGAPFFLKQEAGDWFISTVGADADFVEPRTMRAYVFESELHALRHPDPAHPNRTLRHALGRSTPRSPLRPAINTTPGNGRPKRKNAAKASQLLKPNQPRSVQPSKEEPRKKKALKRSQHTQPNLPLPAPILDKRTAIEIAMQEAQERRHRKRP